MLELIIEGEELYDEDKCEFSTINDTTIYLEHSLISLSKWESKYQKPFLSLGDRTSREVFGYIEAMILSPVGPEVLLRLKQKYIKTVQEYINSPESATTFGFMPERRGPGEVITAELIYYWMVAFQIPFECQTWHLNRLFSLIKICNIKQQQPQKRSAQQIARERAEINARRRAELGTKG